MALTTPSVSPAIVVKEIDLTGVAPNVETSLSGMVGDFNWGPVDEPTRIQDEAQLAAKFGLPKETNAVDYFSAAQYLRYSGNLIVNRTTNGARNAHTGLPITSETIKNQIDYEAQSFSNDVQWIAKYPGDLGNSISVAIFANDQSGLDADNEANWAAWEYNRWFDTIPGTSPWAAERGASNDEIHVVVIDRDGKISGSPDSVLEVFPYISVAFGAKTVDNGDNYAKAVINSGSNYIWFGTWWANVPTGGETGPGFEGITGDNWGTPPAGLSSPTDYSDGVAMTTPSGTAGVDINPDHKLDLGLGVASTTLIATDYELGFDNFVNKDAVDVQILIAPGMTSSADQVTVVEHMVGIAGATRKDCVVVTSPDRNAAVGNVDPVTQVVATADDFPSSSYLIVDSGYLRVYNKYTDNYIYVPAASSTAGLLAATDANYGPWYSPAGERRGEYLGATSISYSPNKAERDTLYKANVNPIVQFSGRGILLFGDKTKQSRAGAFDRINVRRLFLAVEKSVALSARNFMFEFNDEFTRSEFVAIVEPLLREIQARRGIEEFYVQCDARNNTEEVRSRNELVASVFIKPAYAINFITLNFVATRAGLDFEEVIGTLS